MSDPAYTGRTRWGCALAAASTGFAVAAASLTLLDVPWERRWGMGLACSLAFLAIPLGLVAVVVIDIPRSWRQGLGMLAAVGGMLLGGLQCAELPAVSRVGEVARRASCKSNLRQIGLACDMYAEDNWEVFPSGIQQLPPEYIDNPRVFKCPSGHADYTDFRPGGTVTEKSSSYTYVAGLCARMPAKFILAYDKSLANHDREGRETGRNVLFVDAHVEWWPASRESAFQEELKAQRLETAKIAEECTREAAGVRRLLGELVGAATDGTIPPARLGAAIQSLGGAPQAATGLMGCLARFRLSSSEYSAAAQLAAACEASGYGVLTAFAVDGRIDAGTRAFAIKALVELGPVGLDLVCSIGKVLKDPDVRIRTAAIRALGKADTEGAGFAEGPLKEALTDTDAGVRQAAAEALEKVKAAKSQPKRGN